MSRGVASSTDFRGGRGRCGRSACAGGVAISGIAAVLSSRLGRAGKGSSDRSGLAARRGSVGASPESCTGGGGDSSSGAEGTAAGGGGGAISTSPLARRWTAGRAPRSTRRLALTPSPRSSRRAHAGGPRRATRSPRGSSDTCSQAAWISRSISLARLTSRSRTICSMSTSTAIGSPQPEQAITIGPARESSTSSRSLASGARAGEPTTQRAAELVDRLAPGRGEIEKVGVRRFA